MFYKKIGLAILFLTICSAFAQEQKFGKVNKEALEESFYAADSSASAVVLYRKHDTSYNFLQTDGFHVVTYIHERIKIYNKDGFKYATITEHLYKNRKDKESITSLKAVTYNLENGEIVKTKLKNSDTFSKSLNKSYDEEKFTMPNIKEGSIIEYQYRIDSPFSYAIDEIALQYDIPIKKQDISIGIPEYYGFSPRIKGYLSVSPRYNTNTGKLSYVTKTRNSNGSALQTTFNNGSLDYLINITNFNLNNVPALEAEPFVNDMDNYRSAINYELQYVQFPESIREEFTTTWDKVIKTIYNSDQFGKQLTYSKYFKEDLLALTAGVDGILEKTALIFGYVQGRMNWNGFTGYYIDKGVKEAYEDKSGNIADINLILIAMLQEAGVVAYPVLISTRDNGVPLFPTREGFNYVVAGVEFNGNTIFLDASNKFTKPNLVPVRALNWYGRIVRKDGSSSAVSVFPRKPSRETNMMSVKLNDDGSIEGQLRKSYTDYRAYMFRNQYASLSEESYLEKFEQENNDMEVSNYEIKNKMTIGKPVNESCDYFMESQVQIIGDNLYFTPMFYLALQENPFKQEKRNYPIDFAYPIQEKYIFNIAIPEGYETVSLPENTILALPDNVASFTYQLVKEEKQIRVMVDLKINVPVISAEHYESIKELYKIIVEKETEKVVLSKILEDEHTKRTVGGR